MNSRAESTDRKVPVALLAAGALAVGLGLALLVGWIPQSAASLAEALAQGALAIALALALGQWSARSPKRAPAALPYLAIFLFLATLLAVLGYGSYRQEEEEVFAETWGQLTAVADLKVDQLWRWRRERLGDARVLAESLALESLLQEALKIPAVPRAQQHLQQHLGSYASSYFYDAAFAFDARGALRFSVPEKAAPGARSLAPTIAEALRTGKPVFQDVYRDEADQRVYMAIVAPLHGEGDPSRPLGVLALRIDARDYLDPLLRSWPFPGRTAETVLLRREGDQVTLLNDLRSAPDTALRLHLSVQRRETLGVQAALGPPGLRTGVDYLGRQSLGATRRVHGSPWFMVVRMAQAELEAQVRERLQGLAILGLLLLTASGSGLGLVFRDQQARFFRQQGEIAAALQATSSRLERMLASSPTILYELRFAEGRWVTEGIGGSVELLLGYTAEEAEQPGWWSEHLHPEDRDRAMEIFKTLETGDMADHEYRFLRKDGSTVWIHDRLGVGLRRDGLPVEVHGAWYDVTARREAEEAVRESEQRYRTLVEHSPVGVLVLAEERVVLVNQASLRLFGATSADQLLGRHPFELLHPDCHAAVRERIERMVQLDQPAPLVEEKILRLDGRAVTVETVATPFRLEGRKGIHVVLNDLTERLQTEAALRTSLQEKEALLKEVHHRVKNNLQVVSSLLRLEVGRSAHPEVQTAFREMQSRVTSMALLHETLFRSRNLDLVDLSVYLARVGRQVFRSLAPSDGRVALHLDLAALRVELDQAVPCGLLVNELVSNSLKHGFPDGRAGTVTIRLDPVEGGPGVRLEVSDTGAGLPEDFDLRRHRTLGLQLVEDLARQLLGTLHVDQGPGARLAVEFVPRTPAPSLNQENRP